MEIYKITSPNEWEYFAKGNANILFKYTGHNDYLKEKLLRIRLLKEDDKYISTCELYDFIELKCKHLFPQIVDIQLVVLTTEFVNSLNHHGNKLMVKERYGLLLPNMLSGSYCNQFLSPNCQLYYGQSLVTQDMCHPPPDGKMIDSVIFEIKPKWLYDNSSSNYCRTCLLNQLRGYKRHFCPLDLLYQDTIDRGLEDLFSVIPENILMDIEVGNGIPLRRLFKILLSDSNNVFQKLKEHQRINNKNDLIKNLSSAEDVLQNLSLVMTLRDVGLFIRFEKYNRFNNFHNSHNNVRGLVDVDGYGKFVISFNIYDLDLKSKRKYRHWLDVEQKLQSIYNSSNENWRYCVRVKDNSGNLEA